MRRCRFLVVAGLLVCAGAFAETSLWPVSALPGSPEVGNDSASVNVGLRFYSDLPGTITAIRFYKGLHNVGTHVGNLWSSSGTKLASVTFSGESVSGWQQAAFASPVKIAANTTYLVSYFAPKGSYASDENYSWTSMAGGALHVSGSSPGTYVYASGPALPNGTWHSTNYWVDVVFVPATSPNPSITYSISGHVSGSAAVLRLTGAASAVSTTDAGGNYSFPGLPNGSYTVAASQTGYNFIPASASVSISNASVNGTDFAATPISSFWSSSAGPLTASESDTASVTLGLKFYSDVAGAVTAVRFYKGPSNAGTHVGKLWSSAGVELASVTFAGETGFGWQEAKFSVPVNIAANTTYMISYFAPNGGYAADANYSWTGLNSAPLHVSGASPGVYAYGSTSGFPSGTWNNCNYWVDIAFVPAGPQSPPSGSLYIISGNAGGSGATVTLSGAASGVVTADTSGAYTFAGIPNGSYVIAPSQSGYLFAPTTSAVTVNGRAVTGVAFTRNSLPTPVPHTVSLSWSPSDSANVVGYNLYRTAVPGGTYSKVNAVLISGMSYTDADVVSGFTYYYVATAVDASNVESVYSNQALAAVPTP